MKLRIFGTGVAYRPKHEEFVYRDPSIWLGERMQRRVLGLPVVVEHPPGDVIDSHYFGERCVGIIVDSFVQGAELWGDARLIDKVAEELFAQGIFDTSPAVVMAHDPVFVTFPDGSRLLVEGEPRDIDHLALVYSGDGNKGVWTRAGASE